MNPGGWTPGPVPDSGRPAAARPGPAAAPPFVPGPTWPATPSPAGAAPPAGGLPHRQPAMGADDGVARRTPSGLVKRTPRVVDTGEMQAIGRSPDDDLLASLSRVTRGGRPPERPTGRQAPPTQPPTQPPGQPPAQPPGSFAPPWPPAGPPPGAMPPAAPSGPFAMPSAPAPAPAPRRPTGAPLGGLAAGLSGLSPFDPRGTSGEHPRAGDGGSGGSTTSGGLARRVRGAQMPSTNPLSLRRTDGPPSGAPAAGGPAGPGPAAPPARTPQQKQSADAVYSFLTNFTAGVQRGLDESQGN